MVTWGRAPSSSMRKAWLGLGAKPPEADDTCENNVILNRF